MFLACVPERVWCLKWIFLMRIVIHQGQRIGFQKSEIFVSPNMLAKDKSIVGEILGIAIVDFPGVYLGSAMDFKTSMLSFAGRCTLVKHALSAIPIHLFTLFRAPSYFVNQVSGLTAPFSWRKGGDPGIYWRS